MSEEYTCAACGRTRGDTAHGATVNAKGFRGACVAWAMEAISMVLRRRCRRGAIGAALQVDWPYTFCACIERIFSELCAYGLAMMRSARSGNIFTDHDHRFMTVIHSPVLRRKLLSGAWPKLQKICMSLRAVQDELSEQHVLILTSKVAMTSEGKLLVTTSSMSGAVFCEEELAASASTLQHMHSVRQKLALPACVGQHGNLYTFEEYVQQWGDEVGRARWQDGKDVLFRSEVAVMTEDGTFWTQCEGERLVTFAQDSPEAGRYKRPKLMHYL